MASMAALLTACNTRKLDNSAGKNDTTANTPIIRAQKIAEKTVTKKAPIINIIDTIATKRLVLCIKDSANSAERVTTKLGDIYGVKLAAVIKKYGLKVTGAPMAWYKTQQAPYFFEAGLPVDKKPAKIPKGIIIKQIGGTDSVVVAHFYGPYDLATQGYLVLQDWIKDRKKKATIPPYEIYVDDPMTKEGQLKDPYKVQTDIVFTWQ